MLMKTYIIFSICVLCLGGCATIHQSAPKPESVIPVPNPYSQEARDRTTFLPERVRREGPMAQVVFIGASITLGWEAQGKPYWDKEFAPLGAINLAVGGDRTQHVLYRLERGHLEGLNPKVVVLDIGGNNCLDKSAEDMAEGVLAVVKLLRR